MTDWKQRVLKAETVHKQPAILALCEGKSVLDVGCVGQDLDPSSDKWLHARIRQSAASVVGCDINLDGIKTLNEMGFNILTPEQLEGTQQTFDVVVMGDVIEHVNDPGSFLQFYSRFLEPGGQLIVCTPNAFGIRYTMEVFFYGQPGTNPEHTLFLDPFVTFELVSRIGLKPSGFNWLYEYGRPRGFKQRIVFGLSSVFTAFRRYFRPNFMIVLEKQVG